MGPLACSAHGRECSLKTFMFLVDCATAQVQAALLSWVLRGAGLPPGRDCRAGQHPSNRPSAISLGCRAGEDPGRLPAAGQAVCAEQVQQLQGSPYSKQGVNCEEDCNVQLRSPMKQLLSSAQAAGLQQAWHPNYPTEQLLTPGTHGACTPAHG